MILLNASRIIKLAQKRQSRLMILSLMRSFDITIALRLMTSRDLNLFFSLHPQLFLTMIKPLFSLRFQISFLTSTPSSPALNLALLAIRSNIQPLCILTSHHMNGAILTHHLKKSSSLKT